MVTLSIVLGFAGHALAVLAVRKCHFVTRFVLEGIFATCLITVLVWASGKLPIFRGTSSEVAFSEAFAYVALISAAVVSIRAIVVTSIGKRTGISDRFEPRLAQRLPEGACNYIMHLSVSDHCVNVCTSQGPQSIRMRLCDAIDEMEGVDGFRVHRSHWVARDAIKTAECEQGRVFLRLNNGTRVPVSRNYRPVLEESGIM